MKYIKFNKTLCGVDFLLNVLDLASMDMEEWKGNIRSTDFFQIIFIKKGKGKLLLNEAQIDVQDNSLIFISKDQKHYWKEITNQLDGQVLVFQEDFMNDFFADKYFTYKLLYFYQTELPLIVNIENLELENYLNKLSEIKIELVSPKTDSIHILRSLLYYILTTLNRKYANDNKVDSDKVGDNIAYQFRYLVQENIFSKQRIEDYVDLLNVSRITLNKAVKQYFNTTASDYIKSKLIFEIKMKLIYTNKSIFEISNDLHFSEPNHMSRFFKTKQGVSPLQYRINYQNGVY